MRSYAIVIAASLYACGPASAAQPEVVNYTAGTIHLDAQGNGSSRFVAKWKSRRGKQRIGARTTSPPPLDMRVEVTLSLPTGQNVRDHSVNTGVTTVGEDTCSHRSCDMEARGTIEIESPSTNQSTVDWRLAFFVEPIDAEVDLSDLTVQTLDNDGGV